MMAGVWEIPLVVIFKYTQPLMAEITGSEFLQGNIPAPASSVEYGVVGYYDVVGDTVWFGTQDATLGGRVFKSIDRGYALDSF